MKECKGRLHSIETLGTLDGGGIRTVFFLQGCLLRCKYCHNPDTWGGGGKKEITPSAVLETAKRYKEYYGKRGGVTFSGGEPLLQADFLLECIRLLKAEEISVAIDTAGTLFNEKTKEVLRQSDIILLDVKHADADAFKAITGTDITDTLQVLEFIKVNKLNAVIRQVILSVTADENQVRKLKDMAGNLKIELLPYHTLGIHKWKTLGLKYEIEESPPSAELLKKLNEIVK